MRSPQTHRRALADFVGHHISKFQSSRQLMQAIYDAYLAHRDAFLICRILHRDVSAHNILISHDGTGVLNDWDVAHVIEEPRPRHFGRTGTWFFMSIKLLKDPTSRHELQDDLESFFYVVIYIALRYLPHNRVSSLPPIIMHVFEHHYNVSTKILGGNGKQCMVDSRDYIEEDLEFTGNEPLTSWIDVALRLLRDWYRFLDDYDAMPEANLNLDSQAIIEDLCFRKRRWRKMKQLRSPTNAYLEPKFKDQPMRNHTALDRNFQTALAKTWPQNDKAVDHFPLKEQDAYNEGRAFRRRLDPWL